MCRSHALPQGKPAETLKTMPTALASNVWRPTTLTEMDMCYACRVCKLSADCHLQTSQEIASPKLTAKTPAKGCLEDHDLKIILGPQRWFFSQPQENRTYSRARCKDIPKTKSYMNVDMFGMLLPGCQSFWIFFVVSGSRTQILLVTGFWNIPR